MNSNNPTQNLERSLGVFGATLMGLGSIVGTGVFVSLALGAELAGPSLLLSLIIAGALATCNGLSSAQLAAAYPVSGGTYEYAYRTLNPTMGFIAGWLFLCAKSASAATAVLGVAGYLTHALSFPASTIKFCALLCLLIIFALTLLGLRRSNFANTLIVSLTFLSLTLYVAALLPMVETAQFQPFFETSFDTNSFPLNFFECTALMFVAYTGYGRVATLGEEITDPQRNIPRAIITTLIISFLLYFLVAFVSIGSVGAELYAHFLQETKAPLASIAKHYDFKTVATILGFGATTALLGVVLNLLLGLSRVAYAMGRRGDLPHWLSRLSIKKSPNNALLFIYVLISLITLWGGIKEAWSLSACTVLVYYAITNIACLRLPKELQLYPRFFSWVGLFGCLGLAFWVSTNARVLSFSILCLGFMIRFINWSH